MVLADTLQKDLLARITMKANRYLKGTLSEFIGLAASKMLAKEQKSKLSERAKPGRKKNEDQ